MSDGSCGGQATFQGNVERALDIVRSIPPSDSTAYMLWAGEVFILAGDFVSASQFYDIESIRARLTNRGFLGLRELTRAQLFLMQGDMESARREAETVVRIIDTAPPTAAYVASWEQTTLGMALAILGERERSMETLDAAMRKYPMEKDPYFGTQFAFGRAWGLAMLGESDQALEALDEVFSGPYRFLLHTVTWDPRWAVLQDDPRLAALVREHTGLADERPNRMGDGT